MHAEKVLQSSGINNFLFFEKKAQKSFSELKTNLFKTQVIETFC